MFELFVFGILAGVLVDFGLDLIASKCPRMKRLGSNPVVIGIMVFGMIAGLLDWYCLDDYLHKSGSMDPSTMGFIFYPIMLGNATIFADLKGLKSVSLQTTLLIALAMPFAAITIGYITFAMLESKGWQLADALNFGAIVATTDTSAVLAILDSVGGPASLTNLVVGESLFNDAASLVMMEIFIKSIAGDAVTSSMVVNLILVLVLGGIGFGIGMGLLTEAMMYFLTQKMNIFSCHVVLPFVVYQLADVIGVSAVLATCFWGITIGSLTRVDQKWQKESNTMLNFVCCLLSNILFFWAGNQIVHSLFMLTSVDIGWIFAFFIPIYLIIVIVRFLSLVIFVPWFQFIGPKYEFKFCLAQTYGSFRGAMSILMCIVTRSKFKELDVIAKEDYCDQLMVIVGLLVFTTIFVNASTFEDILRALHLIDDETIIDAETNKDKNPRHEVRFYATAPEDDEQNPASDI